jgi:hypothetical protein
MDRLSWVVRYLRVNAAIAAVVAAAHGVPLVFAELPRGMTMLLSTTTAVAVFILATGILVLDPLGGNGAIARHLPACSRLRGTNGRDHLCGCGRDVA